MSNIVPLKAALRDELGTQRVKKVRAHKMIPGIVYGSGLKPTPIVVSMDDFHHATHTKAGENVVIRLEVSGNADLEKTVIIKEIQYHPVTEAVRHVDFLSISLTEKIKVQVVVHVIGEAPGMKQGGVLDLVHHEIEVECLPTNIPSRLDVDISAMNIGDSVHVREIKFPSGVTPQLTEDEVVVAIHAPKAEVEPAAEEAATAEPEVIGKEKKEGAEEGEGAEAEPAAKKEKEADKSKEK